VIHSRKIPVPSKTSKKKRKTCFWTIHNPEAPARNAVNHSNMTAGVSSVRPAATQNAAENEGRCQRAAATAFFTGQKNFYYSPYH
jgi:hypothetical protein